MRYSNSSYVLRNYDIDAGYVLWNSLSEELWHRRLVYLDLKYRY
jgi:hypothetical protein